MSSLVVEAAKRKEKLYGLNRTKEFDAVKSVLTSSSVFRPIEFNSKEAKENLGGKLWQSSTKTDFVGQQSVKMGKLYPPGFSQLVNHFDLGNESGKLEPAYTYQISSTKDTYLPNFSEKPALHSENRTVNWPDMAPQYRDNAKVGNTMYSDTFVGNNSQLAPPKYPKSSTANQKLPIVIDPDNLNMKISVSLGSEPRIEHDTEFKSAFDKPSYGDGATDSSDLIKQMEDSKIISRKMKELTRNSHVFREGDYDNRCEPTQGSVMKLDFAKTSKANNTSKHDVNQEEEEEPLHPAPPQLIKETLQNQIPKIHQDALDRRADQENAHFSMGNEPFSQSTTYDKDYDSQLKVPKPELSKGVPNSKVLQRDSHLESLPNSMTSTEYGQNTYKIGESLNKTIHKRFLHNMSRRQGNNVVLSYDKTRNADDRQMSMSHGDFVGPPSDFKAMSPRKAMRASYDILRSEDALAYPVPPSKPTERQYSYSTGSMMDPVRSLNRRKENSQKNKFHTADNKSSHFTFGNDKEKFTTEQTSKFQGLQKSDSGIPAAGKKEKIEEAAFTFFNHSENTKDLKPDPYVTTCNEPLVARMRYKATENVDLPVHDASMTKNDFQPLEQRRVTSAHTRMFKQDEKLSSKVTAPSHFFHLDHWKNNNFESTAKADFIKPEQMTGRKFLSAK